VIRKIFSWYAIRSDDDFRSPIVAGLNRVQAFIDGPESMRTAVVVLANSHHDGGREGAFAEFVAQRLRDFGFREL
jgi:hypothetical protein